MIIYVLIIIIITQNAIRTTHMAPESNSISNINDGTFTIDAKFGALRETQAQTFVFGIKRCVVGAIWYKLDSACMRNAYGEMLFVFDTSLNARFRPFPFNAVRRS